MLQRNLTQLSIICVILTSFAYAGGPVYSRYGIGDLYYFAGSRSYAMGGVGAGLIGDGFINRLNPAGLASITSTRFSGTFEYSNYSSTDPSGSARYAKGDFGGLAVAIPVARDYGIVLIGELTPYSSARYAIERDDSQLGITSNEQFYGSGGISRFDVGSSLSITKSLHVGVKIDYLAGTVSQTTDLAFTDNTYSNSELTFSDHYSGLTYTLGVNYEGIGDLFNSSLLKPLVLGAILETPASLDLREERFTLTSSQYDTISTRYGTADIPAFVALGASYKFSDRYVVGADFASQDWSSTKFLGSPPVVDDVTGMIVRLRNSTRVSVGLEVLPSKDAVSYMSHLIYRAGFYYSSSYLQIGNQAIDGMFFTAGIGLPIGPESYLDLGFQAGVNGTTDNGLQKDTIFRITASISASELWFVRLQED